MKSIQQVNELVEKHRIDAAHYDLRAVNAELNAGKPLLGDILQSVFAQMGLYDDFGHRIKMPEGAKK
jgi:hypothetical protein